MSIRHFSNLLNTVFMCFLALAVLLTWNVYQSYQGLLRIDAQRMNLYALGEEMLRSSTMLTRLVREYVVTGDPACADLYFAKIAERNGELPRQALRIIAPGENVPLRELFARHGATQEELHNLALAERQSNELCELEKQAIHLTQQIASSKDLQSPLPSPSAIRLVFGRDYQARAALIMNELETFFRDLDARVGQTIDRQEHTLSLQMQWLACMVSLLACIGLSWSWYAHKRICRPLEETRQFAERVANGNLTANLHEGTRDEIGDLRHMLNVMVAYLRSYTTELRDQSHLDPLTDLWNRRYVFSAGRSTLFRIQRYGHSLAFVMIDIDHFKDINDSYGHEAGDLVLKKFAALLKTSLRRTDIPARLGGDEFLLLLPEISQEVLDRKLNELRRQCKELQFDAAPDLHFTLSIGYYIYHVTDTPACDATTDLFSVCVRRADSSLYASKAHGRDRQTQWTDDAGTD